MDLTGAQNHPILAMSRLHPYQLILLALGLVSCAFGQATFKVYPSSVASREGGWQSVLLIEAGSRRFSVGAPKLYGSQVHPETRTIAFTSASGASLMTIQFTTNYPGTLPPADMLAAQVAAKHPMASLVKSSICYTDFGQGQYFELFQPADGGLMLKLREAYVSYPEGSVEFTLSCNGADYDKQKLSFTRLLNSFRSLPDDVTKNP